MLFSVDTLVPLLVVLIAATAEANESKPQPCGNGSAISEIKLLKSSGLQAFCTPFDNCTRYCYDSDNCTLDKRAPPNRQVFLTHINLTQNAETKKFRCCATSRRLTKCSWKEANTQFKLKDSEKEAISDVKITTKNKGKIQVKICQVDVAAGQKPAAVCYSDKCKPSGYCEGKFDDDPTALNPPQGATVDYSDGNSYGLLGLLGLIALVAIPAGCPEITPTVGMASVSYSDSTNGVAKIDSTATVTCADGYFYGSGSGSKTGTVTCSKPALTFNPSSCLKSCDLSPVTFGTYAGGNVGYQLPSGSSTTLTCNPSKYVTGVSCTQTVTATCANGVLSSTPAPTLSTTTCGDYCLLPTVTLGSYSDVCAIAGGYALPSEMTSTLTCNKATVENNQCATTVSVSCAGTVATTNPSVTLSTTTCVARCDLTAVTAAKYGSRACGSAPSQYMYSISKTTLACNEATSTVEQTCQNSIGLACFDGTLTISPTTTITSTTCTSNCALPNVSPSATYVRTDSCSSTVGSQLIGYGVSVTLTCVSGKTVSGKVGGATTAPVSCVDGSIVSSVSLTPTVCAASCTVPTADLTTSSIAAGTVIDDGVSVTIACRSSCPANAGAQTSQTITCKDGAFDPAFAVSCAPPVKCAGKYCDPKACAITPVYDGYPNTVAECNSHCTATNGCKTYAYFSGNKHCTVYPVDCCVLACVVAGGETIFEVGCS